MQVFQHIAYFTVGSIQYDFARFGTLACMLTVIFFKQVLNEFGNVFNIHAHSFLIDANVASSPSMKAFKTALSDFKTEIVDVSAIYAIFCDFNLIFKSDLFSTYTYACHCLISNTNLFGKIISLFFLIWWFQMAFIAI